MRHPSTPYTSSIRPMYTNRFDSSRVHLRLTVHSRTVTIHTMRYVFLYTLPLSPPLPLLSFFHSPPIILPLCFQTFLSRTRSLLRSLYFPATVTYPLSSLSIYSPTPLSQTLALFPYLFSLYFSTAFTCTRLFLYIFLPLLLTRSSFSQYFLPLCRSGPRFHTSSSFSLRPVSVQP